MSEVANPIRKLCAIVPFKGGASAKSRLACLPDGKRLALAEAMLQVTLAAVRGSCVDDVVLQGGDGPGINQAYMAGIRTARNEGASHILLLPADFAALTSADVDQLIASYDGGLGLLPCKMGTGTNAVLFPAELDFMPQFGEGSFIRHWRAAQGQSTILDCEALLHDVDTEADLGRYATAVEMLIGPFGHADGGAERIITYSPKVFLPLTKLCRNVCHYCTFAKTPKRVVAPFMTVDEVVEIAEQGARVGCSEALFTLGEKPELRYAEAQEWLEERGFASTVHYLAHVAGEVRDRTGLLPHINAGCLTEDELCLLRPVSASMGLMLESVSDRLCEKGGPHFGSPDKVPAERLATLEAAGRLSIPFTTGLLIGIGETRAERIATIEAIADLHARYGHIQEVIIQNFEPKADTRMADHPPAPFEELVWTIRAARTLLGPEMSIQCPPNLNEGRLPALLEAGLNDWGGVSPLTPDHVNPEAPWPEIAALAEITAEAGATLVPRLTVYPRYVGEADRWIDPAMRRFVIDRADTMFLAREPGWTAGRTHALAQSVIIPGQRVDAKIKTLVDGILDYGADGVKEGEIAALFEARGASFRYVCDAADAARKAMNGDTATFVVNRNINYTNICTYHCNFCAFSKGTRKHEGAEKPYLLSPEAIGDIVREARAAGATEVCLQGGIHPRFTGETYLDILRAVKDAVPDMHVHAFSPLEITHGAQTLGMAVRDYLALLKSEGLGSLPGTAAEILHDPVRQILCPDKLESAGWLDVIGAAHDVGIPTTATIMFGHVDRYADWAIHLLKLRDLQARTGGISEFVPLPFVAHEAPIYKRGQARRGPSWREAILMHAIGRLILHPLVPNVQASWVKMGEDAMRLALKSGANDMGGTLMSESITRAAGALHGQEMSTAEMEAMARSLGRTPEQRTTLYGQMAREAELT